ncbi:ROK family protein [Phycisphaerales bacterium AB-hyl4]|uniref:ROK family protein n=1 Tax=Natronomicrosphaera hydrolytica TaxID=3242702 RepID=A0ABV4U4F6_9BACT
MTQLANMLEKEAVTLVRVLEQIRREGPISQVEIGQKLGLGRAIVNVHTKKLLAERVVVPTGEREAGGMGRPRVLLDLAREGKAVLGIALDSPVLSGAVMDFSNRIVVRHERDVSEVKSHEELAEHVAQLVQQLQADARAKSLELYSACFSVPGLLEDGTGRILNYVNMPAANGLDAKQVLGQLLGVPIYVVPLASAIYWGGLESDQSDQQIFQVIWDLGVGLMPGRGYEVGFKAYARKPGQVNNNIRDIGHAVLWPGGRPCYCGRRGCLEAYLGGHAITDRWNERHPEERITFSQLLDRASRNEPAYLNQIARQGRRLGEALGWIFAVHQPGQIKLSGQIPDAVPVARDAFWDGVCRRIGEDQPQSTFSYVGDTRSIELLGSCRLALHVRFNKPLLDIVSDDDASESTASTIVVG